MILPGRRPAAPSEHGPWPGLGAGPQTVQSRAVDCEFDFRVSGPASPTLSPPAARASEMMQFDLPVLSSSLSAVSRPGLGIKARQQVETETRTMTTVTDPTRRRFRLVTSAGTPSRRNRDDPALCLGRDPAAGGWPPTFSSSAKNLTRSSVPAPGHGPAGGPTESLTAAIRAAATRDRCQETEEVLVLGSAPARPG